VTLTVQDILDDMAGQGYTDVSDMMVKQTIRVVSGMHRWTWLVVPSYPVILTVANQGVVAMPEPNNNERIQIESVRLSQGTSYWGDGDFDYMDPISLDNLRQTDRQPGRPQYWARSSSWSSGNGNPLLTDDKLVVWPIPDGTYTALVTYYATNDTLSATTDTVAWPEQYVDVIEEHLFMKLARQQRDWAAYDRAKANFKEAYLNAIAGDHDVQHQTDDQVQEWRGWGNIS
jgi:hypothetical protein